MDELLFTWNGKCVDHQIQENLCKKISKLGAVSNEIYNQYSKQEFQSTFYKADELIKDVLISTHILQYQSVSPELIHEDRVKYFLKDIHLFGVDFPVYDIYYRDPSLLPDFNNKISFVFVRSDVPGLDGQLVRVRRYKPDENHLSGQLDLTSPFVHNLRNYFEGWMERFLGWVKHFFIPDMFYSYLYGFPGYERYYDFNSQDRKTADTIFIKLLDELVIAAKEQAEYSYHRRIERGDEESTI